MIRPFFRPPALLSAAAELEALPLLESEDTELRDARRAITDELQAAADADDEAEGEGDVAADRKRV